LNLDRAVVNEIKLVGVFSQDFRSVRPAIKMAREGRFPFDRLITHRLPLAQAEQALRLVSGAEPGEMPLKVVLDPNM
jgi:alcohol dehydrogenase